MTLKQNRRSNLWRLSWFGMLHRLIALTKQEIRRAQEFLHTAWTVNTSVNGDIRSQSIVADKRRKCLFEDDLSGAKMFLFWMNRQRNHHCPSGNKKQMPENFRGAVISISTIESILKRSRYISTKSQWITANWWLITKGMKDWQISGF